jgi:hypothetical protein
MELWDTRIHFFCSSWEVVIRSTKIRRASQNGGRFGILKWSPDRLRILSLGSAVTPRYRSGFLGLCLIGAETDERFHALTIVGCDWKRPAPFDRPAQSSQNLSIGRTAVWIES